MTFYADDYDVLAGGEWVQRRGIRVWQPAPNQPDPRLSMFENRIAREESQFTEAEAREEHAKFFRGVRDERTVMGERVYQRRQKREQRARRAAA